MPWGRLETSREMKSGLGDQLGLREQLVRKSSAGVMLVVVQTRSRKRAHGEARQGCRSESQNLGHLQVPRGGWAPQRIVKAQPCHVCGAGLVLEDQPR